MDAVIVAGGLGSRLLPLTTRTPKHLLPVAGTPFVVHQIAKLAAAGVDRVVLATGFRADQFEPVLGDGSAWGVELVYVTEDRPLGTGGAIRNACRHLGGGSDDPVIVLNGDILSGHDLAAQRDRHTAADADVTLHLVEVRDASAYGCVPTDRDGRVTAFIEKSPDPVTRQINAGCYVFSRRVVEEIPSGRAVSVERETFPRLLADGRLVVGHLDRSYWIDVGTPAALVRASADLVLGVAGSPAAPASPGQSWVHASATVAADAVVVGGSSIGADAQVGSGAVVDGSVVCADAVLAEGVRAIDSVIGPGAVVEQDVVLHDAVVGDAAQIGRDCELLHGIRVACDAKVSARSIRFSP